jgi:hypothetical protein
LRCAGLGGRTTRGMARTAIAEVGVAMVRRSASWHFALGLVGSDPNLGRAKRSPAWTLSATSVRGCVPSRRGSGNASTCCGKRLRRSARAISIDPYTSSARPARNCRFASRQDRPDYSARRLSWQISTEWVCPTPRRGTPAPVLFVGASKVNEPVPKASSVESAVRGRVGARAYSRQTR